jgi:DIRP
MGKPRRFSNAFIKSQIDDLNNYRNSVRNFLYNKGNLPESKLQSSVIQKAKELQPFQVSQIVLAIHPHCNHIHPGSILTITGSNIIVKFFPSELGAQRVPDSKVLAISTEEAAQISEYFSGSRFRLTGIPMNRSHSDFDEKNPSQNKILQDMDYNALSLFIKILEKYTTLSFVII